MRKRTAISVLALILFLLSTLFQHYFPESQASALSFFGQSDTAAGIQGEQSNNKYYLVSRVVDGDTIDVEKDGEHVRVRLIGIDTPETVDPRRTVECFGKEASAKTKELLEGKMVRLETDPSQGDYDKYKRMLAYVYLSDGTLFNQTMISEGYAHEYTYRLPYRYQAEFNDAERTAREEKKGLWADGVCASTS
jgi:micrococcal nuclease